MIGAFQIGSHRVEQFGRCYVIAEAGSNHDGDLGIARELISVAADSGADAVKFQLFRARTLYPANVGRIPTPQGEVDFFELLETLEMPVDWLPELRSTASTLGIDFLCTPFDLEAIDTLGTLGVPALKIASPELTHLPLLERAGATRLPILLSTGMSTIDDIAESVTVVAAHGAPVALLQCVTAYPAPPGDAHLGAIPHMHGRFGVPVGLSDHTLGPFQAPAVAAAVGAPVVEKHVTLSRTRVGPDHSFAIEPDELRTLVDAVHAIDSLAPDPAVRLEAVEAMLGREAIVELLGRPEKGIAASERELSGCDRRAVHAVRDLAAGSSITPDDVAVLRGERNLRPGAHPRDLPRLLGSRLRRSLGSGDGVTLDDLEIR